MKKIIFILFSIFFLAFLLHGASAASTANRLSGRILLDVQRHGEAWYVYPEDNKRYYLGRAEDAFSIMRGLGLGITNANLARITAGDGQPQVAGLKVEENKEATTTPEEIDSTLAQRLSGRIVLQAEENGEAWYINPADNKRYYLGKPEDAYQIMRELSLGITVKDLALVPKNFLNESVDEYSSYEYKKITTADGRVFNVDVITIDLRDPNLEIITDTADDDDCNGGCAAKNLADFVEDNGGFAGINGTYFCPPDYASCTGKENSYFYPIYNSRLKKFINAGNFKYPTSGPLLVFDTNNKFYYFKDTHKAFISEQNFKNIYFADIQAAFGNKPRLIEEGLNYLIDWELDDKQTNAKLAREAFAVKDNFVYLVIAYSATVPDLADVLQAMDVTYAINLDGGNSRALYYNGVYKEGPNRNVPNAIVFRKKE
jgi:exopolysaccharide biosynthesis protein